MAISITNQNKSEFISDLKMAALNHNKNRRNQKIREATENFIARCLHGEHEVKIDFLCKQFENVNLKIDPKELKKLEKLNKEGGVIHR